MEKEEWCKGRYDRNNGTNRVQGASLCAALYFKKVTNVISPDIKGGYSSTEKL
jgi:hypothetical protein